MQLKKNFEQMAHCALARRGRFHTAHGSFDTPNFMPVATQASVKGLDTAELKQLGAQITLVNTYHLMLRPGSALIHELGGIHKFMAWDGPILSDSGGYQVFSLKHIRSLSEEGVTFRSHLDGAEFFLSPEKAVQIQEELGVDIAMVLDECPAGDLAFGDAEKSLERTLRWAKRCLQSRHRDQTLLFAITQGCMHKDLRTRAAAELGEMEFDGTAIGGLSVGERKEQMYEVLSYHAQQLPASKIRYLMGVGTPADIVEAVSQGVDLFDCVMPTRAGRFGRAFVNAEQPFINIRNAEYRNDSTALDNTCGCLCCRTYSRAYLHHLFKAREMLGPMLISLHNLAHYMDLMKNIRSSIEQGEFVNLKARIGARWVNFRNEEAQKTIMESDS